MKKKLKQIFLVLLIAFALIQFIRPAENLGNAEATTDIFHAVTVPDSVKGILKMSCYDCHSNNTRYPWYAEVAPASWLLASHVKNGKKELNFTEFSQLSPRRMKSKLKSIAEQVQKGEMPLKSYTLIHKNAVLTEAQVRTIKAWADAATQELNAKNQ